MYGNNCLLIPVLANSFISNSNQSIFALYQDDNCQSYLYSVEASLASLHGSKSLMWVDNDPSQSHTAGVQFTDPLLSGDQNTGTSRSRTLQIAMISFGIAVILVILGLYLCYVDNKKNQRRGYVPEPDDPTRNRAMAEVSGPGRSVYQYNSHQRGASSTSSIITYLPPYAGNGYEKSEEKFSSVAYPDEAKIANTPSEKRSSRYNLPNSRSRSFSNLTNQVGTGAGLEPGSVQQGRNEGFGYGLGCDLEDNWKRDSKRNSDIILRDAVMTSPHSPQLRPSSAISDDFGQVAGRGGVTNDPKEIYMSA
ncbi:hypothetical protein BGX21_009617 [Mortierella sp. AD011]|nr:hypothetical protein BGX20_000666 [Mortierella sp. AD010]KAF9396210.1 hypothetical protein BGX21_009617 [Mortierella sp. AD011]